MGIQGEGREEPGGGGEPGVWGLQAWVRIPALAVAPEESFQCLLNFSFAPGESASCHLAGGWED